MTSRGELISKAYRSATKVSYEELQTYPLSVLKQVRGLIGRHMRNGHGAWEEPWQTINEVIEKMELEKGD